jgi:hypothetical protein
MAKVNANLDEVLIAGLAVAKKRPQYYLLVVKSSDVVGMIVQKKKIKDKKAQDAKKVYKGNLLIQGVCIGSGANLTLEVIDALPDLKISKLKDFIAERTDLTIKPEWKLVPQFSEVPIESGEEADEGDDDQEEESTSTQATTDSSSTVDHVVASGRLLEEMNALSPDIKLSLAAHPGHKDQFIQLIQAFKSQNSAANEGRLFEDAKKTLESIHALLASLKNSAGDASTARANSQTATKQDTSAAGQETASNELFEELNALMPNIKAFLAEHPGQKQEIVEQLQAFKSQNSPANEGRLYEEAKKTLETIRNLLTPLSSTSMETVEPLLPASEDDYEDEPVETPEPIEAKWNEAVARAVAELQTEIKWVIATNDPLVGKAELELKAVMRQIKAPMETQQNAIEMERYLEDDEVVAEVCEFAFDLRSPLLKIIKQIKWRLPA